MALAGQRILVCGLGASGVAASLLAQREGAQVACTDTRPREEWPGEGVARLSAAGVLLLDAHEALALPWHRLVLSPGVAVDDPIALTAMERAVEVTGEVEFAAPFLRGPCIGITGANGKTTTTALVGHILRQSGVESQVGGNIGVPPAAMVDTSDEGRWNVLELSSFQLETIRRFRARVAACLNVTPDHLDRHHTFERYAAAKRRLFETQDSDGYAVLNADDPTCVGFAEATRAQTFWFSATRRVEPGTWVERGRILVDGTACMLSSEVPLPGRHNLENAMAAATVAHLAGASLPQIAAAVRTFPGVEHRLEFTRELNGVRYYNDSKATNVDATLKAIDAFAGGLWVILGGKDKGSDYTTLREPLREKARAALLIGAAADKIAGQLDGALPLLRCGTLEEAVPLARERAQPGDVVLLAPACASFDQFRSYEHRGQVFKELVGALEG